MSLTEPVKILDDKIRANKAQYDLDRQAAKISALSSVELEKYEYLTGEDLGYKPDVVQKSKFEYSPLGEAFNKVFKKDNKKFTKHSNDLYYNSVHNFNKNNLSNFNEISSIDSKFDTINKFYKDLLKLSNIKSQNENTRQKKITVLKNASLFHYMLINVYKKEYEQVFESKDENWKKKYDYKNLKKSDYQVNKADITKEDQELPSWIGVSKSRFNEIYDEVIKNYSD